MGSPYTMNKTASLGQNPPRSLPRTLAYGLYDVSVYEVIAPLKTATDESAGNAAECVSLVERDFPDATAAEYSNSNDPSEEWCYAVFGEVHGVLFDPTTQSCVFTGTL